jgi:uncharacterized cupin superfamily protein
LARWTTQPGSGQWEKAWGLFEGDEIVGHVDLVGNAFVPLAHRTRLSVGIEEKYRSQGFGKQLLATAINWASQQSFLAWIDLDVFSNNQAAINLYKQFKFVQVGKIIDRIRVEGKSIDDIQMALNLSVEENWTPKSHDIKVLSLGQLPHHELSNRLEKLSRSAVLTDPLDFENLFVHHEVLATGRRSSNPHFHTHIEEMFLVLEGNPTVFYGQKSFRTKPGDFVGFSPGIRHAHYIQNQTQTEVRVLVICSNHNLDQVIYGE